MTLVRIQLRRGTSAEWNTTNPQLASGERGIETDTGFEKVGNGTDLWNDLPYVKSYTTRFIKPVATVEDNNFFLLFSRGVPDVNNPDGFVPNIRTATTSDPYYH